MPQPSARSRALLILGLVVAAALALRCTGIGHALPQHPDEDPLIVTQSQNLRLLMRGDPAAARIEPHYPLVLATTLALVPQAADDPLRERADPLGYHLRRAASPHLRARLLVALLSSLAVPVTYLLARRFLTRPWALCAAGLVATSLLHVHLSQQARPHGPLATWIALALLLDLRLVERGRTREHLLAGLATALAVSCLHNGASTFLPLAAAQALRLRRDGRAALLPALSAWALVGGLAWAAYFGSQHLAGSAGLHSVGADLNLSGHVVPRSVFDGGGFARVLPLLALSDPLLLALSLAGVALAAARALRGRALPGTDARLLCVWAVPYLLVMGLYNRLPARFLLPLVPPMAVLGGWALQTLAQACAGRSAWLVRRLPIAVAGLALALPAALCARLAWLELQPDPSELAADWLARNADREHDLLYLSVRTSLPLLQREEGGGDLTGARFEMWDTYQAGLDPELLRTQGWRTRRLIGGEPGSLRLGTEDLLEVLSAPPAEPARARWGVAVLPFYRPVADSSVAALEAAGGRLVWSAEVEDRPRARHPLAVDVGVDVASLLLRRRPGRTTLVYELPGADAPR